MKTDINRVKHFIFIALFIGALSSCKKDKLPKGTPDCLQSQIDSFQKSACSTGATAKEYTFQNQTVYLLEPGNCGADMTSVVLSNSCAVMGYLGGITGATFINGEDFSSAIYIQTVWQN
jgi:hypothetical protein